MQLSPATLGAAAPDPSRSPDRLSARWLIAVAARTVREVGELVAGATRAGKRLATFTLDGEVRFASAADRAVFAEELATAVTTRVGRYPRRQRTRRVVAPDRPHGAPTHRAHRARGTVMPRELIKMVELDASPEEVWQAIATGPGISTWFVPHQVEEREGGAMSAQFGGGFDAAAQVRAWEPGRRFA